MRPSRRYFLLLSLIIPALLFACAPRVQVRQHAPLYRGSVEQYLAGLNSNYNALKAYMSLKVRKRSGSTLSGNALADLAPEGTQVRFFQLGIEVGDLRSYLAKRGLRHSFYEDAVRDGLIWWDLDGYTVAEHRGGMTVTSGCREVVFAPGTFMPLIQTIRLPRGLLAITYSDYRKAGRLWYPFSIHVSYRGNSMDMKMKQVKVSFRSDPGQ